MVKHKPPNEFFPTPHWVLSRFLDKKVLPAGDWLDAGAGAGALIEATAQHPEYGSRVRWTAAELDPYHAPVLQKLTGRAPLIGDFRTVPLPQSHLYDVVIANPPFSLAQEFLHRARQHGDYVCFLLRLNFLQGGERSLWLTQDCPDVYVVADRPSFTPDGNTDTAAYAWMVWHGYRFGKRTSGRVEVLAATPTEVRKPKDAERKPRKRRTPKEDPDARQGRKEVGPPDAEAVRGAGTGAPEAGSGEQHDLPEGVLTLLQPPHPDQPA